MIPRVQLLIGFLCLALLFYFAMLARTAFALIATGDPLAVGLGAGVLILPIVGAWAVIATLRAGLGYQRLARLAAEEGADLDVTTLQREAADALFESVRAELEADPDNWRRWYRLARAYDHAGDRRRARDAMRTAVSLQAAEGR